ncbi:YopX family protein [Paraclostridium dentum]|jgi:uncharacterized phage protein (TIGR01671 family)|uniref:YopX family protein n=1 Tax=Paraclostridium dentum TaxID=2662455 RepID=UPI00346482EE
MRKVKFRVYDKKNKKMYYGYAPNRPNVITLDGEIRIMGQGYIDDYGDFLANIDYCNQEDFVLMLYVERKDMEGREIYEEDIVRIKDKVNGIEDISYVGVVRYNPIYCQFVVEYEDLNGIRKYKNIDNFTKVIGNIYEGYY